MFKIGKVYIESFDYLEMENWNTQLPDGSYKEWNFSFKFYKGNNIFVSDVFETKKELLDWYNVQVDKETQQNLLIKEKVPTTKTVRFKDLLCDDFFVFPSKSGLISKEVYKKISDNSFFDLQKLVVYDEIGKDFTENKVIKIKFKEI